MVFACVLSCCRTSSWCSRVCYLAVGRHHGVRVCYLAVGRHHVVRMYVISL